MDSIRVLKLNSGKKFQKIWGLILTITKPIDQLMMIQIVLAAIFGLGQSGLLPSIDVLFPIGTLLLKLLCP
jgi:hypothetical protein